MKERRKKRKKKKERHLCLRLFAGLIEPAPINICLDLDY